MELIAQLILVTCWIWPVLTLRGIFWLVEYLERRKKVSAAQTLEQLDAWYDMTYHPKFKSYEGPYKYRWIQRDVPMLDDIDLQLGTMKSMPVVENHTTESAYASKKDDKGRPNIVSQHFVPQAEVTAMAARADADQTALTGAAVSGSTIPKGS